MKKEPAISKQPSDARGGERSTLFEVWGCRGSRTITPPSSKVGSYTSCYSLLHDRDLWVFDAGRGLGVLSRAVNHEPRFAKVERVHLLLSHAHMDHWEGLKDSDWFWRGGSGRFELTIHGTLQTLKTIETGYAHPAYVSLQQLAAVSGQQLSFNMFEPCEQLELGGATISTFPLNHFSGWEHDPSPLETTGYLLSLQNGASIAYFSDHMPTAQTRETEQRVLAAARLALFDAHYATIAEQNFGHGSQECSARIAVENPQTLIIAGHHGSATADADILSTYARVSEGVPNLMLAVEGDAYAWRTDHFENTTRASALTATSA